MLVHFHIIRMKDSFLVWIGSNPGNFSTLAVAMTTKYVSCHLNGLIVMYLKFKHLYGLDSTSVI